MVGRGLTLDHEPSSHLNNYTRWSKVRACRQSNGCLFRGLYFEICFFMFLRSPVMGLRTLNTPKIVTWKYIDHIILFDFSLVNSLKNYILLRLSYVTFYFVHHNRCHQHQTIHVTDCTPSQKEHTTYIQYDTKHYQCIKLKGNVHSPLEVNLASYLRDDFVHFSTSEVKLLMHTHYGGQTTLSL